VNMNDENEMLPFCMRCFHVGAFCDDNTNFCHMCGSEGTCINIKRGDIYSI
jgi:rRNA maturation endonuclease Nob1